jgi:hypothetical protein
MTMMSEVSESFSEQCNKSARKFLKTVLIADNQPVVMHSQVPPVVAKTAVRRKTFGAETSGSGLWDLDAGSINVEDSSVSAHNIDLRKIVNSFSKHGLTCGSYLPDETVSLDEIVETTFLAARFSDISIIDWQLQVGSSSAAIAIVKKLLDSDRENGGRLRLIIIYTGESDLEAASRQLSEALVDAVKTNDKNFKILESQNARIRFFNKPTRADYIANPDVVSWESLPDRAIEEFAILSKGLLKAFALESVAAIRNDTHRLLAQFSPIMDGVYAGQRATATDPDDAAQLIKDVVLSELSVTIDKAKVTHAAIGAHGTLLWLSDQAELQDFEVSIGYSDSKRDIKRVDTASKQRLIESGLRDVKKINSANRAKLCSSFFVSNERSDTAHKRFSALSTLARHSEMGISNCMLSAPVLTLGLILESSDPPPEGAYREYLLCLQPRCDAVRLDPMGTPRGFSFVEILVSSDDYELVIPRAETYMTFKIPFRDLILRTIRFAASAEKTVVAGVADGNDWYFTDSNGKRWCWVAELREQQALSLVNRIMGTLTRIGLNQSEWLRLKSS